MSLSDTTKIAFVPRLAEGSLETAIARAPAWSPRVFALTAAALLATAAVGFSLWRIDDAVVPWDSKNHFYAMFRFLGEALRDGTLPLWNPYHFGGYPAVADPQSLLFTPTMLLFAAIAPAASMAVFDAVIFAHLVLGGIGMLGLARRWRWSPAAGLLAGLIFMLGGAASSRLQHTGMIISYAWFPLALWSLQAALDRCSLGLAVLAGVLATLMALGRDQVAYLFCLVLVGEVVRTLVQADNKRAFLRDRLPVLACAGAVTLGLMIVPVLLTMQFLHGSNRPGITYGIALEGSLDPVNLMTLFAPNVFGSLDRILDYWGPGAATAAGNDWTDRTIDYLFVGTLPIVLIVWHGLAGGRLAARGARAVLVLGATALLYAFGRHTPAFGVVFDWFPGVRLYRRPADAAFVLNVALAFGSGYLLQRHIAEGLPRFAVARGSRWLTTGATIAGLAVLVGSGLAFARDAGDLWRSIEALALASGFIAAVVIVLLVFRETSQRGPIALALVAATAAQLGWRNCASALNAEPTSTYDAFGHLYPDEARGLAVLRAELARREAAGEHPRVEILGLGGSWQNASMVFKLPDTLGYNPLRIAAYERAVGVAESSNDPELRTFPETFRGYNSRLAGLLGLDYLLLDRPIADLPRHFPRPRATLLYSGVEFFLYRLDNHSAPRAYVATTIHLVDSDRAIDEGSMPLFDIAKEALVDSKDRAAIVSAVPDAPLPTAAAASQASITRYDDNAVSLSVDAAKAGVLVLHDLYYPGWTATVDGAAVPVLRTNLIFRGVAVRAGHHTVEFSFHPFSGQNLLAALDCLLPLGHQ